MTIYETTFESIGKLIKKKREDLGWTLQELADRSGLPGFKKQDIWRFENGKRYPSRVTLNKILTALDSELFITLKDKEK